MYLFGRINLKKEGGKIANYKFDGAYSLDKTIFVQFENEDLKVQLEKCARDINCEVYWGEASSPDIIAIPYFISIIDRNIVGTEMWKYYLEYEKEVKDDEPCIIIDKIKDLELPVKKNIFQYDIKDKNTIPQIISAVKEAKKDLDAKIKKRRKAKEVLEADLKILRDKYPECVLDGIVDYDSFEWSPYKVLWILKEVNDKDGGKGNLSEFISLPECLMSYNMYKRAWSSVMDVSYGIINNFPTYEVTHSKVEEETYALDYMAFININKLPGSSRNYYKDLKKAFGQFKDIVMKQIEYIDPDIIICGNTFWLFYDIFKPTNPKVSESNKAFMIKGKLWIEAYHPGQTRFTHKQYYSDIIKSVRDWETYNVSSNRKKEDQNG